jgi:hypothetical protein
MTVQCSLRARATGAFRTLMPRSAAKGTLGLKKDAGITPSGLIPLAPAIRKTKMPVSPDRTVGPGTLTDACC